MTRRTIAVLTATLAALVMAPSAASAAPGGGNPHGGGKPRPSSTYTYVEIGVLGVPPAGPGWSTARDLNSDGQVIGHSTISGCGHHSYLTVDGKSLTDMGTFYTGGSCTSTYATAINDSGHVVGYAHVDQDNPPQAFYYRDGKLTQLPSGLPEGSVGTAYDLNDSGLVVGSRRASQSDTDRAVVWRDGVVTALPGLGGTGTPYGVQDLAAAVNNAGDVVGVATAPDGTQHAVRWRDGQVEDLGAKLGSGVWSRAFDVNDAGQVLIRSAGGGDIRALIWQDGTLTDIGGFHPLGINEAGQVVGTARVTDATGASYFHAVVTRNGAVVDLNKSVTNLPAGVTLGYANAVNDSGVIAGWSCTNNCVATSSYNYRGFILVPNA